MGLGVSVEAEAIGLGMCVCSSEIVQSLSFRLKHEDVGFGHLILI